MPTNIRRRRRDARRRLTSYRAHELLNGRCEYPVMSYYSGYGDGVGTNVADFISEEMKLDWLANRQTLIEVWQSGELFPYDVFAWELFLYVEHDGINELPWCERQFGADG
jgi:hypothetical protein